MHLDIRMVLEILRPYFLILCKGFVFQKYSFSMIHAVYNVFKIHTIKTVHEIAKTLATTQVFAVF